MEIHLYIVPEFTLSGIPVPILSTLPSVRKRFTEHKTSTT